MKTDEDNNEQEEEQLPTTREVLEAAFESVEEDDSDEEEFEDEESEGEDYEEEDEDDEESEGEESDDGDSEEEADPAKSKKGAKGDASGDDGDGDDDSGDDGAAKDPAPSSWTPEAREHWKDVPDEIKAQITKREKEVTDALGASSQARKFANDWAALVNPYQPLMQAQGATAYQAVGRLLEIGAGLATGNSTMKADIIKNLITQYQVDLPTLDHILAGEAPPAGTVDVQSEVQKALQAEQQRAQQFHAQQKNQEVAAEIETFKGGGKAEFFEDVRDSMADLMEIAAKRGKSLSIEDAYNQACQLDESVKKVLDQRAAAAAAKKRQSAANKKKRAASSVKGKKGGKVSKNTGPVDTRSAIEQAWEANEGRKRNRV